MARCKVTILVKSVTVVSNGKAPGLPGQVVTGNNAVTGSIIYPRGGQPQLTAMVQADLQSGVPFAFSLSSFYGPTGDGKDAPGLFKTEEIEDEAPLTIQVTSSTDPGAFVSALEKVYGGVLAAAAGMVPGGQLVAVAAQSLAGAVGDALSAQSGNNVRVIGEAKAMLNASELLAGKNTGDVTLRLIAKDTIHDQWYALSTPPDGGPSTTTLVDGDLTTAGHPNGTITLNITVAQS